MAEKLTESVLPPIEEPVRVALVGAGLRSQKVYAPLFQSLRSWIEVVAVCDPVAKNTDTMAKRLNVPAFYDLRELVRSRPMEAALIVTPPDSHYSLSAYLSRHGIHNIVETPWASTLEQARQMVAEAHKHGVLLRVAENFFRTPIDRILQKLMAEQVVGRIHRIFSYADHTGYHNNSRWISFAGAEPKWAQSIQNVMPVEPFHSTPQRYHEVETFEANFFQFHNDLFVIDQCANAKGLLGRHARPGYNEWQGTHGTIVYRHASDSPNSWRLSDTRAMIRRCSSAAFESGYGIADEIFPIHHEFDDQGRWLSTWADTHLGKIEHVNPFRPEQLCDIGEGRGEYGSAIMDHLWDFAMAIRGLRPSEFTDEDALMSMMMLAAVRESALCQGQRVALPIDQPISSDREVHEQIHKQLGVDPFDVDAMLSIHYPKP